MKEKKLIEAQKALILDRMSKVEPSNAAYGVLLERLEALNELELKRSKKSISPDTIATIAANLGGIALVLFWEERHIVASKALTFVAKLRI